MNFCPHFVVIAGRLWES